MCLFLDEASYCAEKLLTDINLLPLMPDADNNFGGSLDLATSFPESLFFASLSRWNRDPGCG